MNAADFFDKYTVIEISWKEFLKKNLSYRNSSALGMTALRICYYITKHPDCSLKEVAISLAISLGSASQMVQAMTIGGILKCTTDTTDRRRISITPLPILTDFFNNLH